MARLDADIGDVPDAIPSDLLFNLPAAVTMRDAWTIGMYGALSGADLVRLGDDRWPDGIARFGERVVHVEATEAWEPGRRRGDEYRDEASRIVHEDVEEWIRRAAAIGPAVRASIEKKEAKFYAGPAELVIYVGFSEFGIRRAQVVEAIRHAINDHRGRFSAVRVIWNNLLY